MLKLCIQGLLLLAVIGAFALCLREQNLREQNKYGAPAANAALPRDPLPRQTDSPVRKASTKDQLAPRKEPPVTTAEAEALAAAIQTAVTSGDSMAFGAQFDFIAFGTLVHAAIDGNTVEAHRLRAVFENGLPYIRSQIIDEIIQQAHSGGSYQYLRTVQREDGPRLLFRLLRSEGTLNYHEIILARRPQGVRAVDLFVYASGERMSATAQRIILALLPREQQTLLASASGSARASLRALARLEEMTESFKRGDNQSVLAMFMSLPDDLRAQKAIQLIRMMAAQKVSDAEYAAAMDEYRKAFPGDPSIHLMSLDSHIIARRYAEFHDALNRLNEQVGGDPYLQVVRADVLMQEGRLEQAEQVAQDVIVADPRNLEAHSVLVAVSLLSKRFETTAYLLAKLRDELGFPIGDLMRAPEYAEFVASPAFARLESSVRR